MSAKQIFGCCMVAGVILALFAATAFAVGFLFALSTWGVAIVATAIIFVGVVWAVGD